MSDPQPNTTRSLFPTPHTTWAVVMWLSVGLVGYQLGALVGSAVTVDVSLSSPNTESVALLVFLSGILTLASSRVKAHETEGN